MRLSKPRGHRVMRKLATAAIAFCAAIFLSQYVVPTAWQIYLCVIFAVASLIGLFFKDQLRLRILLISLGLAAGFIWSFFYAQVFFKPAEKLSGRTESVTATVCDTPVKTDDGAKLLARIETGNHSAVTAQLYIYGNMPDAEPGSTIVFTATFRLADTIYGEKTESFISRGIYLLANVKGSVIVTGPPKPFAFLPVRMAHGVEQMIDQLFPEKTASFMRALIIGDTSGIYRDTRFSSALMSTGTSHIVSVSGMNIAFLMGFVTLFTRKKRVLAAVGIPLILIFLAVVGFTPPVVRAGVMQVFLLLAPILKRENDPITSLSASLMLILLFNPFAAGSAGLQLSFSAILGIMLFTERIFTAIDMPLREKGLYKYTITRKALRFVIGSFATTLGALVLSAPLTAIHFGTVSIITPLTNLLILWAVTLAFCGGIVAVAAGFLWLPAGSLLAFLSALPANYVISTITVLSHAPIASVYTANPAIVIWLVYVYLLICTALALRLKLRQLIFPACLSAVLLCLILLATSLTSIRSNLSVTALDVGQGQSIVVTSGKFTAVIDCGSSSGKDAGDITVNYLLSHGRTVVDLLVLTHFHSDHANGIMELMERGNIAAIAIPEPSPDDSPLADDIRRLAVEKGIVLILVTEDLVFSYNDTLLTLYAPLGDRSTGGNNERGLAVLCTRDSFDAFITGDMNANNEQMLLQSVNVPDIELLIAGHHGSKTSTSDALLNAVTPEAVIISVGYNTYGHPSRDTLERLVRSGIMVYRTDEAGHVTINSW